VIAIDYMRRVDRHDTHFLLRQTVQFLKDLILRSENLIRQDYPGYTGRFCKSTIQQYRDLRNPNRIVPQAHRELAEHRCRVVGFGASIPLMHQWYEFMFQNLRGVFPGIGAGLLYDVDYVDRILSPQLVARYAQFTPGARASLERCYTNLSVLGQIHIARLGVIVPRIQPPAQNGAAFVADNQNIHRESTVKHVTNIFEKLMEIVVPPGQTTLGSIITKCALPPKAIIQLTQHYCEPVTIYEIPKAYPRALDAVWAYIEMHPEKNELYARVRDEMTDNIGMCAQGNLSRICNIVSGYLDGIQPVVSQGELLQNKISAIASDGEDRKVERALAVLEELDIPEDQWAPWIEALG